MTQKPYILISNDDGVHAPGIKSLWSSLKNFADLVVVAPSAEQSAVGLSTSIRNPLRLSKIDWGNEALVYSVSGTPSDCIKIALNAVVSKKPDLIVSGINRGANSGRNVLYSGTVGAAIEGILQKIPAIAFSCYDYHDPDYVSASQYVPTVVDYIKQHPLPSGTLLNINFPEKCYGSMKGIKMAAQGKEFWGENPDKRLHPSENEHYYWLGMQLKEELEEKDSEIHWLKQGYATAVPIHINDLTDYEHLAQKKNHFEEFFVKNSLIF